jgi:hypothetical protein
MRGTRMFVGTALAMALAVSSAWAQQNVRLRGTVASLEGPVLTVKARDGAELKVTLADNVVVSGVVKRSLADIKPGDYLGVGAMPQADGSQRAIQINIFSEAQRGTGEGFRPWDGAPQGTMTNATVANAVTEVEGQVLTMKYKDGEKKIIVTPQTLIITSVPGDRAELKPGANITIPQAVKKPDGTFEAARVSVGRDGIVPN